MNLNYALLPVLFGSSRIFLPLSMAGSSIFFSLVVSITLTPFGKVVSSLCEHQKRKMVYNPGGNVESWRGGGGGGRGTLSREGILPGGECWRLAGGGVDRRHFTVKLFSPTRMLLLTITYPLMFSSKTIY